MVQKASDFNKLIKIEKDSANMYAVSMDKAYSFLSNFWLKLLLFGIVVQVMIYITAFIAQLFPAIMRIKAWFIPALIFAVGSFFITRFLIQFLRNKRIESEEKRCKPLIASCEENIRNYQQALYALLSSEEGQFAQRVIAPDYFYPAACKRILYYLRNGHAETWKEAVREYDAYIHRKKLEKEMGELREDIRAHNAETAEALSAIQQSAQNTEFWSVYNAYLNERRG